MTKNISRFTFLLRKELRLIIAISLGIFLFILFFQPFPYEFTDFDSSLVFIAGLGAIVFLVMMLVRTIFLAADPAIPDEDQQALVPSFFQGFLIFVFSSVSFAFYLRYVGKIDITYYIALKAVVICITAPLALRLYTYYKCLMIQNKILQDEKENLHGQFEAYQNETMNKMLKNIEQMIQNSSQNKDRYRFEPIEIIDNAEILCRLGCIAINGALEIDLYGNINNTHISGTHLINGVGGSALFASNSYISVFTLFSVSSDGNISSIVPMVPHVDVPEHHVGVVVTEQGLADLRGLSPIERAESLIHSCAHPDYRPFLKNYLEKAKREVGGHQPHILEEAFSFYQRVKNTGSMKEE